MPGELKRFDYFLFGMAYVNHMSWLDLHWIDGADVEAKPAAYVVGMVEHTLYLLAKVATVVAFFFINLSLIIYYTGRLVSGEECQCDMAKMRLGFGTLILGEALAGVPIDALGMLCPPLAYRIHNNLRRHFTHFCFKKLCSEHLNKLAKIVEPERAAQTYLSNL